MPSSAKKAGGADADEKEVKLEPYQHGGGYWFTGYLEYIQSRASKQDEYLSLYLSFLHTNVRFSAPFPNREEIVLEYTKPAVAVAPGVEAVAAVAPTDELVNRLFLERNLERDKLMAKVRACGTRGFTFLMESMSHESQTNVRAEESVIAADSVSPKDGFALYQAMRDLHARGGDGGIKLTSAETRRIEKAFINFQQNNLSTDDYHKLFLQWIEKRKCIGLPDFDAQTLVSEFYSKLDPKRFRELNRERENTERALLLNNLPVAELTLSQALQHVKGWIPSERDINSHSARTVSVFAASVAPDVDEVQRAANVLAASMPGATAETVLLALTNAKHKNAAGSSAVSTNICPQMVNGKPFFGTCSEKGCSGKHPFYMHEMITGQPCSPENQAKIVAFQKKKAEKTANAAKKQSSSSVMVTTTKHDSDDDDDVEQYFIHMINDTDTGKGDDADNDDDDCYNTDTYSVLMNMSVGNSDGPSPFDIDRLLFDSQAGVSIVRNVDALINRRPLARSKAIIGISGDKTAIVAEFDGELPGLPGVRFVGAPQASANILAQCDARKAGWVVKLDGDTYTVITPTTSLVFNNLPGWNAHPACLLPTGNDTNATLVASVASNLAKFSKAEQQYAAEARLLQHRLGDPCDQYLINGLSGIDNAKVVPADVRRATAIAGPPLAKVRGGTHQRSTPSQRIEAEMPRKVNESLTMEIDIFFWRGLAFLIAVLLPINYIMGTYLKHRTVAEIGSAITAFIAAAAARMFTVTLVRCDGEKAVAAYAPELNRTGVKVESQPGVHCPHVERANQILGEFVRGNENGGLPYRLGKALLVMCVLFKISRLNLLPTKSATDGFGAFVHFEGIRVDAARDLKYAFGDYVEAIKTTSTKTASRTEACIAGIPTMNRAGSVVFYKLATRQMVTRQHFKVRPIPDVIIQELNDIADEDNLPPSDEYIGDHSWEFEFEDDEASAVAPVVPPRHQEVAEAGVMGAPPAAHVPGAPPVAHVPQVGAPLVEDDMAVGENEAPQQVQGVGDGAPPQIQQVPAVHPLQQLQLPAPARRGRHGSGGDSLRFIPGRALMSTVEMEDRAAIRKEFLQRRHWHDKEYCFKISVRAALRDRGDSAKAAIMDELENIVDKGVFHGVHMRDLTSAQRKAILRSVTFLKDKYTAQNIFEKFKARMCVDGSRQDHSMYEDVSSPTATCASVLSCAAIAAAEHRHIMTVDVKGAFLHADMKATGVIVHVQLDKVMTQFLVELDPTYAEFVRDDGTCVVELDKALYGTIEAAKLWYDNISAHLISDGFARNPYDPCVFNRINANGIQTTVVLYVDDMMVTCEDSLELDRFGACLRARYGKDQITEHRGTILDFLGMTFDFTVPGKVKVTMKHLVDEIIAGCGVVQERKTPATEDLFEVRDTVAKLSPVDRDYFRSYTAKLLYIGKRVKPEMLTAISFLTTRATAPDTDDLAKLQRALGYLLYTRDRGIVLCIGDTMTVGGFIDAAYGVHTSSGKSHSGCAMVLGNAGPVHVKSTKQKLVTKSSTEAELVALSDYASQAIWLRNFILAQGYDVGPVVLHQDNMSCMALIKRGGPASERSRHIDIRYFWVKEKVDGKDAIVRHLPTDKMYVNVMTKPVQGQQFIRERNALTNWY